MTDLTVAIADGIALLTLNRPERRNAYTAEMGALLNRAYRQCDDDDSVRVIVLTGAGDAFCAGADFAGATSPFGTPSAEFTASPTNPAAFELRTPVIAAVNGHAIGIGLTIALQTDIRHRQPGVAGRRGARPRDGGSSRHRGQRRTDVGGAEQTAAVGHPD
jgi:enoyl-CoA hydratase/carnithine racemase